MKKQHSVRGAIALAGMLVMSACEVTNPGPVQDVFLSERASHAALVNGAGRRLQEALNNIAYTSALPSREIFPGGQTGAHGHAVLVQGGYFAPGSFGGHFNLAVQARFIAETALDLFESVDGTPNSVAPAVRQQAMVYAGYANRVLGENWCEAVFAGGPAEPGLRYFQRAEQHFTNAIANAASPALVTAARAGRAQVRVWLGDWTGAAADAATVTTPGWNYWLNSTTTDAATRNMPFWANANSPYRAYTMWYTWFGGSDPAWDGVRADLPAFQGYYALTGDPRVPVLPQVPAIRFSNAALSGYGQTPFINQGKYRNGDDDLRLAGYNEMRLIEAEAALNAGNWQAAMTIIDDLRAGITSNFGGTLGRIPDVFGGFPGYSPLPAPSNVATAMTYLMRERGIEMWMEGRRWGDLRRWADGQGLGGNVQREPFETVSVLFADAAAATAVGGPDRLRCFDIPDAERNANPNIPTVN